jgi:hypothetical protein
MLAVSITLTLGTLSSAGTWIICILSLITVIVWNLNAAWIIAGAAVLSWVFSVSSIFTG